MQLLIANFTEFQLATVITFLLHETVFFLSGLPSLLFERFGLFAKYKIQVRTPCLFFSCLFLFVFSRCPKLPVPTDAANMKEYHA
jgi:plant 4alpha-monomethylsterol monooxygenase